MSPNTVLRASSVLLSILALTADSVPRSGRQYIKANAANVSSTGLRASRVHPSRNGSRFTRPRRASRPTRPEKSSDSPPRLPKLSEQERDALWAAARQQALGATDEQWKLIAPKLKKVRTLQRQAHIGIGRYVVSAGAGGASGGGGFSGGRGGRGYTAGRANGQSHVGMRSPNPRNTRHRTPARSDQNASFKSDSGWWRPSQHKSRDKLTKGERICEDLLNLLESGRAEPKQIRQKMTALRKVRQDARKELAKARQELREVVTPRQQAALILMRYLN
jgi:hypothetical protein